MRFSFVISDPVDVSHEKAGGDGSIPSLDTTRSKAYAEWDSREHSCAVAKSVVRMRLAQQFT
jgi:hypothetical protein